MYRRRHILNIKIKKLLFILGVIVFFILSFYAFRAYHFLKAIGLSNKSNLVLNLVKPKTTYTTVLLGYGGGNHEGTYLTDTIIIAHINFKTRQALLISIPRDIWVKLPTKSGDFFATKINAVYQLHLFPKTYPDVNLAKYRDIKLGLLKNVFKQITGLEIDSYLAINFSAFTKTIDLLGGIDVTVDRSFTDKEYPIENMEDDLCGKKESELEELEKIATESPVLAFPCRYETIAFIAGKTHLDGIQALKFARSRHSPEDGGDFQRAKRQQKVIEAVSSKLISPLFIPKIPSLMDKLETEIQTDADYSDIQKIIKEIPKAKKYKLTKLVLTTENYLKNGVSNDGQYILIPKPGRFKWDKVKQEVNRISKGTDLTPTSIIYN